MRPGHMGTSGQMGTAKICTRILDLGEALWACETCETY